MTDFVDPGDPVAVEAVLRAALVAIGTEAVAQQLSAVPDLQVQPGRRGGLLRSPTPTSVRSADRRLLLDASTGAGSLEHIVGGIVLATDPVGRAALPGALAALVTRSVTSSGARDDVSVLLTALRDAVDAAG